MSAWRNNMPGPALIQVAITVEEDQEAFLSLTDPDGRFDLIITDDFEAQTFFDEVAKARALWDQR